MNFLNLFFHTQIHKDADIHENMQTFGGNACERFEIPEALRHPNSSE